MAGPGYGVGFVIERCLTCYSLMLLPSLNARLLGNLYMIPACCTVISMASLPGVYTRDAAMCSGLAQRM